MRIPHENYHFESLQGDFQAKGTLLPGI